MDNLESMLKNMISFKATVCLLELPMTTEAQSHCIETLNKYDSNFFIQHTRYLKVIEALITSLNDLNLEFIVNLSTKHLIDFLNLKQGFFLLRKLYKKLKDTTLQRKVVEAINQSLNIFIIHNNGHLLIQTIINNFDHKENKGTLFKNTNSFNKKIINMDKYTKVNNAINNENESSNEEENSDESYTLILLFRAIINFTTFKYNEHSKLRKENIKEIIEHCFMNQSFRTCVVDILKENDSQSKKLIYNLIVILNDTTQVLNLLLKEKNNTTKDQLLKLYSNIYNSNEIPLCFKSNWKSQLKKAQINNSDMIKANKSIKNIKNIPVMSNNQINNYSNYQSSQNNLIYNQYVTGSSSDSNLYQMNMMNPYSVNNTIGFYPYYYPQRFSFPSYTPPTSYNSVKQINNNKK